MPEARPVFVNNLLKLSIRRAAKTHPQIPISTNVHEYGRWITRNLVTALSALIRGERSVQLEGTNTLTKSQEEFILRNLSDVSITRCDAKELWKIWHDGSVASTAERYAGQRPIYLANKPYGLNLQGQGYRLEFVKILGVGGSGAVSEFKLFEGTDPVAKRVAVKCPSEPEAKASFHDEEIRFLCLYSGAEHITNKLNLDMGPGEMYNWIRGGRSDAHLPFDVLPTEWFPEKDGIMILEIADHGELFEFLGKVFQARLYPFSKQQLWDIWDCCE